MNPEVIHFGGADCVTGSCHLLKANGLAILVDCGAVQGGDTAIPMDQWSVTPRDIDYLFLTHAHVDHMGRVPDLIDQGFSGEIICTRPTREILFPMLEDAMGFTRRSDREIQAMERRLDDLCWDFEYRVSFDLKNGVKFRLGNAGHILGSCFIRFWSHDPDWSVVFSGDLGPRNTPILPDPDIPDPCDLLILESTYGDRLHEDRKARAGRLAGILSTALSDGGKVFIPAFALGRCQELIYEMDRIFSSDAVQGKSPHLNRPGERDRAEIGAKSGKAGEEERGAVSGEPAETGDPAENVLPGRAGRQDRSAGSGLTGIPVFVDTPLGLRLTKIYSNLDEFWDGEARHLLAMGDHPIDFDTLYAVEDHNAHRRLGEIPGPCVIIAGSGMCTGGRIVDHLAGGLGDRRNNVLFVGYQAKGTPGRDILRYGGKRGGYVWLDGRRVDIRAGIHELTGYSAHADQKELVEWVNAMERPPGKIRLVHGENRARQTLARILGADSAE